jgi:hypothetical protein
VSPLTIIDPVTECNASGNQHTLDHNHLATIVGLGGFGLPCRYGTRVHAVSNASDNATDNKMRQMMRGTLQDSASGHNDAATENCASTSERVSDKDGQDSAQEAAQIVRCNSNALVQAALRSAGWVIYESFIQGVD